jgi:glycosyltransferase involved in cell wall biosynthesis
MFGINMLIVENALSLPMHIPLGLALTETIAETQIPTIAHHHDFYWERSRYAVNAIGDYLHMAFPPSLPNMIHAVINTTAREELALRTGTTSYLVPNVMDFDRPLFISPERCLKFRSSMGLDANDILILQPTRIVQRKGIEHAINLVKALNNPRCKLVISHEAGDEGYAYADWLEQYARDQAVDLRLVPACLCDPWRPGRNGSSPFSLWEIYASSDFVTFPSLSEGFGNAFLEAIYFEKPLLVNRYSAFIKDIEPLGFDLVTMDGFFGAETLEQVKQVLGPTSRRSTMVRYNYEVARRYFSYNTLRTQLNMMFTELLGHHFRAISPSAADNLIHLHKAHIPVQSPRRPAANLF